MKHEFVEFIPDVLLENTIYISIVYTTVVHKCFCGCGNEVVTPLSPTDWKLTFDGESISLYPSIGNWSFKCKSHYWIKNNQVHWAGKWSQKEIEAGQDREKSAKEKFFKSKEPQVIEIKDNKLPKNSVLEKLKQWWLSNC
jgi:Family of unknown function (DUF6527)